MSRLAMARPMPLVPPVTSATFPDSPRSMGQTSAEHVTMITTVDADRAAGGEVGAIGGQKCDQVCDLLGRSGAAQWIRTRETRGRGRPIDATLAHFLGDQR